VLRSRDVDNAVLLRTVPAIGDGIDPRPTHTHVKTRTLLDNFDLIGATVIQVGRSFA
jgi:hypothetical protein